MRDTDRDWTLLAETDPYWAVISADEFKGSRLSPEQLDRFFQSGEGFVQTVAATIRGLYGAERFSRALDFGCGVGRLTIPLARRSDETVGLDVSDRMLAICREQVEKAGLKTVRLALSDDELSQAQGRFTLVNTFIVLQHIPPARGYRILRNLLDRIEPLGFGSLQLSFAKARKFYAHEQGAARYYRREGNMLIDLVETERAPEAGTIMMFDYDLNIVFAMISEVANGQIHVFQTDHGGHLGVHLIFQKKRA